MLKIYAEVIEVVKMLNPVIAVLDRKDPDLANQCRRARASMPLNLREGSHGRGKARANRYSFVAGSADEIIAIHDTAVACEYIEALPDLVDKLGKIVGTMRNCMKK